MSKRELHRFHVQSFQRLGQRQRRNLVIRLRKNKQATAEKSGSEGGDAITPTDSALIPPPEQHQRRLVWGWPLFWLSLLSTMGVTVTVGVLLLTKLPPPVQCQNISPLSSDSERLYCAQIAAQSGKLDQLEAAIKLVQNWGADHPLHAEAQRLMQEWSKAILHIAQQKAKQGDSSQAVNIARKIPASSPTYAEAQAEIASWQGDLDQAQATLRQFQAALKAHDWQQASKLIAGLLQSNQKYWSAPRVDALMKQLDAEKQAWQRLQAARELANSGRLAQLQQAIALAGQVGSNTSVKAQAVQDQSRWSRTLLQLAATFFNSQDFANVINVAQAIPRITPQYAEAQDWLRLAQASAAVKQDNILAFVDALAAVRQIQPQSPLYRLAVTKTALWQQELHDHTRLFVAGVVAGFGQKTGLTYAIDQATQITPGRPQRILAQTLIAQWRKQIQQVDNQRLLEQAQQVASRGTLTQLKAAVEVASKVQLGQPLRIQAQTLIANWQRRIETIEDQPILELAQTMAQRQDLIAAISTAEQIRPGRALYAQAQQAIINWQTQVQTAQDRSILDAATALADQGRLDAAIATAAQISPDRPLYEQAQVLINDWASQKAAISGNSSEPETVPLAPDQNQRN